MENKVSLIDLHTHSTASDGTDKPADLVSLAIKSDIDALALTDHDTLKGLSEAGEAAKDQNLYFIRGCEISTSSELGEVHILGLWLPEDCGILEDFLEHLRKQRHKRNEKMIFKLRALGFNITLDEVEFLAKGTVGRPHMAAVLVNKGYAANNKEAFDKYLGENGKAYMPKIAPSPAQACRILSSLGATAVMAHPLLRPWPVDKVENLISSLIKSGLTAIEVWHSAQTKDKTNILNNIAMKYRLATSGGSDYHGTAKPGIKPGLLDIQTPVPNIALSSLISMRKSKGLPY